jgi:DNA polymerase III subunit delta
MPLIVMHGDDGYSMWRAVAQVTRDGGFAPVDVMRLNTLAMAPQAVLMAVGTPGLFADRRLVLVEGLGSVKDARGGRGKTKTNQDGDLTISDLADVTPSSTTSVVVLAGAKPDSRLVKDAVQLARSGAIDCRAFPAPRQRDMPRWLGDRAKEQGILIESRALHQLAQRVGEQVLLAGVELEKLSTAVGPRGQVTAALVEELVPQSAEQSIFPLIDAIAAGRMGPSFALLNKQLAQIAGNETEVSLPLIRMLARQFRILLQIRLMVAGGAKRADVVSALKIPDYFADRYFGQAKRLSEAQLTAAVERLAATEQSLKNGESGDAELHLLLAHLTGSGRIHPAG